MSCFPWLVAIFLPFITLNLAAQSMSDCTCDQVSLEYLYWNAREDLLPFGIIISEVSGTGGPIIAGAPLGDVSPVHQKFHWSSGSRVGINHFLPCSCWNFGASWTFFQTNSHKQTKEFVIASMVEGYLNDILAIGANSRWNLHFNTLMLDAGYSADFMCCLRVRPHAGVLGVSIWQDQKVKYFDMIDNNGTPINVNVKRRNNFWGVGPTIGVDLQWLLCQNLRLISKANAAIAFGRFDVKSQFFFSEPGFFEAPFTKERLCRGRPMVDAYLGLGWDGCWCRTPFVLGVGYEIQYWWQQWHAHSSLFYQQITAGGGTWGDLLLHGLTVSLNFVL